MSRVSSKNITVNIKYSNKTCRHYFKIGGPESKDTENSIEGKSISETDNIEEIVSNFLSKVTRAANNYLFLRGLIDRFADDLIVNNLIPFLESEGDKIETGEGQKMSFQIDSARLAEDESTWIGHRKYINSLNSLGSMSLLSMVAHYDVLISRLLKFYFNTHPEALGRSEKTFTFGELKKFASIQDAHQNILEREVDDIMYGSHVSQIEWLDKRLKKDIKVMLRDVPAFCEIFERRNLYAHSDSFASTKHLNNCIKFGCSEDSLPTHGEKIKTDVKYIIKASEVLIEYGIILSQVVWRTLHRSDKQQMKVADEMLLENCAMIHKSKHSDIAIYLLDLASNKLRPCDDFHKREMIIRRASYLSSVGKDQEAQDLLKAQDWSAATPRFKMYVAAMSGKFEDAAELINIVNQGHPAIKEEIRDSPAFLNAVTAPVFEEKFKSIFGESIKLDSNVAISDEKSVAEPASKKGKCKKKARSEIGASGN